MAETVLHLVPPQPVGPIDAAVAVRASSEEGDSACLVLGNELVLTVLDVRTERPLLHGAYIRSCKITADGNSTEYLCPDQHRYPRTARSRETYAEDSSAQAWQKAQFYRYVGSSLKRLGYYTGNDWPTTYPALKQAILNFHAACTADTADQSLEIDAVVEELGTLIEEALGGRDHVPTDGSGVIRIGLPEFVSSGSVTVRLEFHDIKFLTCEDMDAAAHLTDPALRPGEVRPSYVGGRVLYDRAAATWPTAGAADPDHADHESGEEFSNWYLHCGPPPIHPITETAPDRVRFRNFVEFTIPLESSGGTSARRTIYAMTWAPPVWHESESFFRAGFAINERNFVGPTINRAGPASNSLHVNNGASQENYSIFGIFRTSDGYRRLHTGIDLTGLYDGAKAGSAVRTPIFAVNGGRYISTYPTLLHGDEAFTRYVHIVSGDRLLSVNRWAKAGTLVGRMGRSGIDAQWPTHVHFETLVWHTTGWTGPSSAARWHELAAGRAKIAAAGYPHDPAIHTPRTDSKPQYVKYQYGTWVRDPGMSIRSWLTQQLGGGGWAHYSGEMPASYPGYQMPPCRCEFGATHTNNPSGCTASCVGADGAAVDGQVKWAKGCWAIRTSQAPSRSVCPGLASRGAAASFTLNQRVQYNLWRLGHLTGNFDGDLGAGTRRSVEAAMSDLGDASVFVTRVVAKEKDFPTSDDPRREAIKSLMQDTAQVEQLVGELEALADERFGT